MARASLKDVRTESGMSPLGGGPLTVSGNTTRLALVSQTEKRLQAWQT